jgi:hypothetical protein
MRQTNKNKTLITKGYISAYGILQLISANLRGYRCLGNHRQDRNFREKSAFYTRNLPYAKCIVKTTKTKGKKT